MGSKFGKVGLNRGTDGRDGLVRMVLPQVYPEIPRLLSSVRAVRATVGRLLPATFESLVSFERTFPPVSLPADRTAEQVPFGRPGVFERVVCQPVHKIVWKIKWKKTCSVRFAYWNGKSFTHSQAHITKHFPKSATPKPPCILRVSEPLPGRLNSQYFLVTSF
jgi:hypothetical protein